MKLIISKIFNQINYVHTQLEEILQETSNSINPTDLQSHETAGETYVRIGPPDQNLIKQRASLLEQLEIEAEFEVNQEKILKSEADLEQFVKKEIHLKAEKVSDSDDIKPHKDLFISQVKQELNETSRASQTLKTSLGKKSKLKEEADNIPTTSNRSGITEEEHDLIKKFEANIDQKIKKEMLSDNVENSPKESKTKRSSKEVKEEKPQYFDDQYDHESFHRV